MADGLPSSRLVAPSQGRGSKHRRLEIDLDWTTKSPPHRGVDRNLSIWAVIKPSFRAPSQGRRNSTTRSTPLRRRRPLTGAWIETTRWTSGSRIMLGVAPHRGVDRNCRHATAVPCGRQRRPLTGAWIETPRRAPPAGRTQVAPSQGRGSKRERRHLLIASTSSPPHRSMDRKGQTVRFLRQPPTGCSRNRSSRHVDRPKL